MATGTAVAGLGGAAVTPLPSSPCVNRQSQYQGPAGHRVLVEPVDIRDELLKNYPGLIRLGFEIPKNAKDQHQQAAEKGIVREIGPTAWKDQGKEGIPWAEVGDLVEFVRHAGVTVDMGHEKQWRVVNDIDIYYNYGR